MNITSTTQAGEAPTKRAPVSTYVDDGDRDNIQIHGSAAAITRQGVDIGIVFPGPRTLENGLKVLGADGHDWTVFGKEWYCLVAQRPRTEAEREAFIDRQNSRVSSGHFSLDRQSMCKQLAWELLAVGGELMGDKLPTRQTRRTMLKRIRAIARVQLALMYRDADMHGLRQQLADVGIHIAQQAYLQ